ncbi:MAG TPA: nitrile hydratase subunit beta [Oceanospirillaceae bacterium]|nr:nitrile hydratase subunit beta [Oceanospirillaceae bacterium]
MYGGHDLGGMDGLGPINPQAENTEPVFHSAWEKRAFALTLATGFLGQWNIDVSRHARERQHPAVYLTNSYYQTWLAGLDNLLQDTGMLDNPDLHGKAIKAEQVHGILSKGGPVDLPQQGEPAFAVGDKVRVTWQHTTAHTRVPRYVAGRFGRIHAVRGFHVFADANAQGDKYGAFLYSVAFKAQNLWGPEASARDVIYLDLWQPHLQEAL